MKRCAPIIILFTTVSLSACGGSSNSSGPAVSPSPSGGSLATLLQTGVDSSDVTAQWDCVGNDGQDPVNFSQRFFANGDGQILDSGLTLPFTWTADSDTSFSVAFPADINGPAETLSLTDVSFSTVNIANDQYNGIDSRDGTALSCTKIGASSVSMPSTPSAGTLSTLLQTGVDSNDVTTQWDCLDNDVVNPERISLRFFANGDGQLLEDGLTFEPFTWAADSDTSFSVAFPAGINSPAETVSLTDVSFSTVDSANDQFNVNVPSDGDALSCTKTEASSVSMPLSLVETIVNDQDSSDFGWDCDSTSTLVVAFSSYEFLADGTGRRFSRDFSDFFTDPPALTWTADEANSSIDISWNGQTGNLGAVSFQDVNNFTAVDSFEADSVSCVRSDIPNAPTPPPQPQPISTCPCSFTEVEQFLVTSNEPSTTVFVSNVAGGRILDIDLPGTTFQLFARNIGIRDCGLTFTGSNFNGENNQSFSSLSEARIASCDEQLDSIINNN